MTLALIGILKLRGYASKTMLCHGCSGIACTISIACLHQPRTPARVNGDVSLLTQRTERPRGLVQRCKRVQGFLCVVLLSRHCGGVLALHTRCHLRKPRFPVRQYDGKFSMLWVPSSSSSFEVYKAHLLLTTFMLG